MEPSPPEPGGRLRWSHRPRVVTRAFSKADGFGFNTAHQQLFIPAAGGKAKQLTSGEGSVFSPAWSPDGSRIAFSRSREGILDAHCSDIWTIAADGSDQRRVTSTLEAATTPSWSPDGQSIAFTGNENGADAVQYTWLVPANGGTPRNLTAAIDRPLAFVTLGSAPGPAWSADGEAVYVLLADHGNHRLARVCLDGVWQFLTDGPRQLKLLTADDARRRFVYASCSNTGPRELFVYTLDDQREAQITTINAEWTRARSWPQELTRTFAGPSGEVFGRVLLPPGPGPHPLLVDAHGGPHSQALRAGSITPTGTCSRVAAGRCSSWIRAVRRRTASRTARRCAGSGANSTSPRSWPRSTSSSTRASPMRIASSCTGSRTEASSPPGRSDTRSASRRSS